LNAVSQFNKSKQRLLKRTSYYGQSVEMDGQGRLLLPSILRESAELKGEVAVSGRVKFLEVQNAEALRKEVEEPLTSEDEQELDRLGI
jgi:MraZ protein